MSTDDAGWLNRPAPVTSASNPQQESPGNGPSGPASAKAAPDPTRGSPTPFGRDSGPLSALERAALERAMVARFWATGDLRYKLHSDQRVVADAILESTYSRYVLEIARRWGKTWLLVVLSAMACLRQRGARVAYGAPTGKHLAEFILPTLEKVTADAPPEHASRYNAARGHWEFSNGSYIHLFGCDDRKKADRGRGPESVLAVVDEAGFVPIIRYVVRDVLRPQTMHTGGRLLLGSTPAAEPDHDFTAMAERAESRGNYARRTLYDNPRLTPARIEKYIAEDAADEGQTPDEYRASDTFQREYLALRVVNSMLVAVPEWESQRAHLLVDRRRPEHFDAMVSLDFGGADPHFAVFGYWDFTRARLYIEDEVFLHAGENTAELADAVKQKERALWGTNLWEGTVRAAREKYQPLVDAMPDWLGQALDREAPTQPFLRYSDTDTQLVRDLWTLHGMVFVPTQKTDKQLHVNALRVAIRQGEIEVNPRCKHLDRHLRGTTWKDHRRRDFVRRNGEHGDGVDALCYLHRNIDKQRNPYPAFPLYGDELPVFGYSRGVPLGTTYDLSTLLLPNTPLVKRLQARRRK